MGKYKKKYKALELEVADLKLEVRFNKEALESVGNLYRGIECELWDINRLAAYNRAKPETEIVNLNGILLPADTTVEEAIFIFYGNETFKNKEKYKWESDGPKKGIVDFKEHIINYAWKIPKRSGGFRYILSMKRTKNESEEDKNE